MFLPSLPQPLLLHPSLLQPPQLQPSLLQSLLMLPSRPRPTLLLMQSRPPPPLMLIPWSRKGHLVKEGPFGHGGPGTWRGHFYGGATVIEGLLGHRGAIIMEGTLGHGGATWSWRGHLVMEVSWTWMGHGHGEDRSWRGHLGMEGYSHGAATLIWRSWS